MGGAKSPAGDAGRQGRFHAAVAELERILIAVLLLPSRPAAALAALRQRVARG